MRPASTLNLRIQVEPRRISNYSVLIIKNDPAKRIGNDPPPGKFGRFNIVMFIDLEHFRSKNDHYGHAAGNSVPDQ